MESTRSREIAPLKGDIIKEFPLADDDRFYAIKPNNNWSDVVIRTGTQDFHVHRAVVCAQSRDWDKKWGESKEKVKTLTGTKVLICQEDDNPLRPCEALLFAMYSMKPDSGLVRRNHSPTVRFERMHLLTDTYLFALSLNAFLPMEITLYYLADAMTDIPETGKEDFFNTLAACLKKLWFYNGLAIRGHVSEPVNRSEFITEGFVLEMALLHREDLSQCTDFTTIMNNPVFEEHWDHIINGLGKDNVTRVCCHCDGPFSTDLYNAEQMSIICRVENGQTEIGDEDHDPVPGQYWIDEVCWWRPPELDIENDMSSRELSSEGECMSGEEEEDVSGDDEMPESEDASEADDDAESGSVDDMMTDVE